MFIHVVGDEVLLQLLRDRRLDGELRAGSARRKRKRRRCAGGMERRVSCAADAAVGQLMMALQVTLVELLTMEILLLLLMIFFLSFGDEL